MASGVRDGSEGDGPKRTGWLTAADQQLVGSVWVVVEAVADLEGGTWVHR